MEEECKCPPEGLPAWMGTFADLMSLLMCFFVLLLSFSEMDVAKFKQIAGSMEFAFGVQNRLEIKDIPKGTSVIAQEFSPGRPDPTPIEVIMQNTIDITKTNLDFEEGESSRSGGDANVPAQETAVEVNEDTNEEVSKEQQDTSVGAQGDDESDASSTETSSQQADSEVPAPEVAAQQALAKKVAENLKEEIVDGAIEIESLGQQLIIRLREKGSFPAGSAFLQPRFRPVIAKVAKILVDVPGVLTISGHTDNEPIQSELYRSNWDLSAQRAVSVAHEMLKVDGIQDKKMQVVGYANSKPLTLGNTITEQRRNRRVEITIMQGEAAESDEIATE
ncbi:MULTISPECIES: flagellar motor protein MotB [Psychromonas]|uniref:flagellar motor protein MotB n=1 Tax=Psychromonas TaxID=67572 RepID=UPI0004015642|nr:MULTISPECIES: flagellar motor protein MotB [Psychromonas]MBB1272476.1 flagellar motor protein MotB [Psychromonas sp. SR45-3]